HYSAHHLHLHSFPTRRSSDLAGVVTTGNAAQPLAGSGIVVLQTAEMVVGSESAVPADEGPFHQDMLEGAIDALDQRGLIDRTKIDRKSTRLNSSHRTISYAVF